MVSYPFLLAAWDALSVNETVIIELYMIQIIVCLSYLIAALITIGYLKGGKENISWSIKSSFFTLLFNFLSLLPFFHSSFLLSFPLLFFSFFPLYLFLFFQLRQEWSEIISTFEETTKLNRFSLVHMVSLLPIIYIC